MVVVRVISDSDQDRIQLGHIVAIQLQFMLDHSQDHVLEWAVAVCLHHLLLGGQDREDEVLGRVLVLRDLGQVVYLLLAYGYGIVNALAVQVNVSLGILCVIDLIEDLPGDIPVDLLLGVLILLLGHGLSALVGVLILPIQVIVHLRLDVLILLLDGVVPVHTHLLVLLGAHRVLGRQLEVGRHVLVRFDDLRGPETVCVVWLWPRGFDDHRSLEVGTRARLDDRDLVLDAGRRSTHLPGGG